MSPTHIRSEKSPIMVYSRIAASRSRLLKDIYFQKISKKSKPFYSFCSSSDKPPNEEHPDPKLPLSTRESRTDMIEDAICRVMEDDDWSTGSQSSIRKLVHLFDHNLVSNVLNRIPNRALEFFNWVEKSGFKHDRETHYKMISILCTDRRLDEAKHILLGIPEKGLDYDEEMFVLLINGYSKSNRKWDMVKNCVKIFLKMEELGVVKTINSYNCLLEVIISNKKYAIAEKFFDKMLSEGIIPSRHTYTLMISGFCRSSRVETANRYFQDMKSRNILPDFVLYNAMINAYVKVKKMDEAEKLLMEMKGHEIEPLLVTYNLMINGYVQDKRLEDAENIITEMNSRKLEPNLITYNTLINGYTRIMKIDNAKKLVDEMIERNIEPDLVTYVTMIKGYVMANRVDDGLELVKGMKRKRFGGKVDVNLCLGLLKEEYDVEKMSETQRNVLRWVEDYVERVDLLAMRYAAREMCELANQGVGGRHDPMESVTRML